VSQNWDFYFLSVDDKPASIFVDLGIVHEAPVQGLPFMAYIRVFMQNARSDGLSSSQEFESLKFIEDSIQSQPILDGETVYVGRNTSNGCRDFYFYVARSNDWDSRVKAVMKSFASYEFDCGCRNDPEWKTYFEFLYPSATDRQCIENRRVCDVLEKRGDLLNRAREIDHWAYFPNADARSAFIDGAVRLGFRLCSTSEPDGPGDHYGVRISRVDLPAPDSIDDVILPLFQLAAQLGGRYDGWETQVIT
jgi:uncharacterized protein (TIGR01619 family)